MENEEFQRGYITGVVATYCEQIRTGVKLIAEIGCDSTFRDLIRETAAAEECKARFFNREYGRIAAWIFEDDMADFLAQKIILEGDGSDPTPLSIWATGKLFGYSDEKVLEFLKTHTSTLGKLGDEFPTGSRVRTTRVRAGRKLIALVEDFGIFAYGVLVSPRLRTYRTNWKSLSRIYHKITSFLKTAVP